MISPAPPFFLHCPHCDCGLFHVETTRRIHFDTHIVCASLTCEACHTEYELLADGTLELVREPAQEVVVR